MTDGPGAKRILDPVEAYRAPRAQLRRLLGIPSRYELDGVWLEYTVEDFRREGDITTPLLAFSDTTRIKH